MAAGVRFSPTEGYAWDFSTKDKKEPVIPSERELLRGPLDKKHADMLWVVVVVVVVMVDVELQLKLKQKYEKMEKQRENSARVDAILIQLMKKHAPEIAEKLESTNAAIEEPAATQHANETGGITDAVKRHKVA